MNPTRKQILRFEELNEKHIIRDESITSCEIVEMNELEKIVLPVNCIRLLNDQIEKLLEVNRVLREGLSFYAKTGSWQNYGTLILEDLGDAALKAITEADKLMKELE
jgi:hypothetical protein